MVTNQNTQKIKDSIKSQKELLKKHVSHVAKVKRAISANMVKLKKAQNLLKKQKKNVVQQKTAVKKKVVKKSPKTPIKKKVLSSVQSLLNKINKDGKKLHEITKQQSTALNMESFVFLDYYSDTVSIMRKLEFKGHTYVWFGKETFVEDWEDHKSKAATFARQNGVKRIYEKSSGTFIKVS